MLFLNYQNEANVYESDLQLFESPNWLNDHCVNFYFRWLEYEYFPSGSINNFVENLRLLSSSTSQNEHNTEEYPTISFERFSLQHYSKENSAIATSTFNDSIHEKVLLLDPSIISFFMLQCNDNDDFEDLEKNIHTRKRDLIFLPITNRNSINDTSSHWSLLIFLRQESGYKFLHYDSHGAYNYLASIKVAKKLLKLIFPLRSHSEISNSSSTASSKGNSFSPVNQDTSSPQQNNSYDCGMYVCCITRLFLLSYISCPEEFLDVFDKFVKRSITEEFISQERKYIKRFAEEIFNENASDIDL